MDLCVLGKVVMANGPYISRTRLMPPGWQPNSVLCSSSCCLGCAQLRVTRRLLIQTWGWILVLTIFLTAIASY